MNKKILALFVSILLVGSIITSSHSAERDENGIRKDTKWGAERGILTTAKYDIKYLYIYSCDGDYRDYVNRYQTYFIRYSSLVYTPDTISVITLPSNNKITFRRDTPHVIQDKLSNANYPELDPYPNSLYKGAVDYKVDVEFMACKDNPIPFTINVYSLVSAIVSEGDDKGYYVMRMGDHREVQYAWFSKEFERHVFISPRFDFGSNGKFNKGVTDSFVKSMKEGHSSRLTILPGN